MRFSGGEFKTAVLLGALALLGSDQVHAADITSARPTRSSVCKPGDQLVTYEPFYSNMGLNAQAIPPKNTDGQQSIIVLGEVKNSDGQSELFVERAHGLPDRDVDTRAGFLQDTPSLRQKCTEFQGSSVAKQPTVFVSAGEVWGDRVVNLRKTATNGQDVFAVARVDQVLSDDTARVQWVNPDGKIVTETAGLSDLFVKAPTSR